MNDQTTTETKKAVEYKIIDYLTNGNYINGITAVDIAQGLSSDIMQLIEEEHEKNCKWLKLYNEMNDELVKYRKQLANQQEERNEV